MRKLATPPNDPVDVYDTCVSAVTNITLRQIYQTNRPFIQDSVTSFSDATVTASWASLPRVPRGNSNVIIAGSLTKKHLTDLYDEYMVGTSGASRKIYDDILVAAGGLCPFCGGIGHVFTLDHYLPKSNFPLYSVMPENLVPCCRDCNTGKNASFGAANHQQTLHPYLDSEKYFTERWVQAEVCRTNPILVEFECAPPSGWSHTDKGRVQQHFVDYHFASRFGIQAGAELARLADLRTGSLRGLSPDAFRAFLLDNADSKDFDLNGWSRTMYSALAAAEWFWMSPINTSTRKLDEQLASL